MKTSFSSGIASEFERYLISKFNEKLVAVELTWRLGASGDEVVRRYEFSAEDAA
jgi:hypothetical protein